MCLQEKKQAQQYFVSTHSCCFFNLTDYHLFLYRVEGGGEKEQNDHFDESIPSKLQDSTGRYEKISLCSNMKYCT